MEDGKSRSSHDHFRYAMQSVTRKMHLSADRPGSPESTQNPCYLGNAGKVAVSNTAGASKQNQGGRRGRRAELAFWEIKLVKEWHLRKTLLKQMESGEKDALRLSRRY